MSEANELTEMELSLAYQLEKRFCSWDTAKRCARFAVDYVLHKSFNREPREWLMHEDSLLVYPVSDYVKVRGSRCIKVREVLE